VTPKAGAGGNPDGTAKAAAPGSARRSRADGKGGSAEPGQVGRRPSNPVFLALVGVLWIGAGFVALLGLQASWKLVPGIVFIGVGLFYVRGAATTAVRRSSAPPAK
jgi:hypothetical protein